ncbi:death domain-associated protein 6 isoform X1 [Nycticebus coucang]|uniref:death domain-associated protein 6 isoform X1 n=1 Tax=Nycticebus coucang TaxID=9470 RepID=UPI00234C5048|nr:death domain-associated protein 6 isoform X1 [Nycticebus coucang]XP_053459120.1 death domain-associated protein 6 isoform X1 [Nycticebus coucang]XP_053459121.1 death domain-associated protein 6 isoform X1 [Nycticebus coucang]XP_053459122.1 death domain-associated protein 6 isoform X1 [Nycticebus coucang]XP_053459123.1 death domain-associated protein 6 isoform X1 [Nycticebus coucang]XP_053459124.1 death domain-associated protein 6 isoform X1 [Nycticebus coucang]
MATANSIIVLDDDEEDEAAAQPGPSNPSPNPASPGSEVPGLSDLQGAGASSTSDGKKCYKLENEKLFEEFLELCKMPTADHPEVVPFLHNRKQRAHSLFLASAEFCNILSRVLSRARSQPAKLYVYINELCTVLKAHSAKKKLNLAPAATTSNEPSGSSNPPTDSSLGPTNAETTASTASRTRGSRRQIQHLEQLLALYVAEIRRLQEKELDLSELDDPDSTYLQEARLKRKLIRLFGRLCELKDCSSLTGRVIEQRIPYRGTRYPEVNRRIERLINKPDAFPDYGDVLRAVEKAAARHSLGLPRQQLQVMAQDAFRDVGIRLQERRHLDLIYNFGCHLTDDYRPGIDPALSDPVLARRLRENRTLAMSRLDEVISKYAMMQDKNEEGERKKRRARLQGTSSYSTDPSKTSLDSGEGPSGMASQECPTTSRAETDDEDDEESDEEEEEEEEATDSEEEEYLEQMLEGQGDDEEEEEEEEAGKDGDRSPMTLPQISTEKNLEPGKGISRSSGEQQNEGLMVSPSLVLKEPLAPFSIDAESNGKQSEELPMEEESPISQLFELEIEALPLDTNSSPEETDISSSRKQSEDPFTTVLENGAAVVTSTSFNGGVSPHPWGDSSPPSKKSRKEKKQTGSGPLGNSYVERQRAMHMKNGKKIHIQPSPPSPLASMSPVADSSTRVDSPSHSLVTSSLCSPSPVWLSQIPQSQPPRPSTYKMSVATQCDPEEIIVLSDSD